MGSITINQCTSCIMKDFRKGVMEKIPVVAGGIGDTFHGGVVLNFGAEDLRLSGREGSGLTRLRNAGNQPLQSGLVGYHG